LGVRILNDLRGETFDELAQNKENIILSDETQKLMKQLRSTSKFNPKKGINPPLLILISGVECTGKSSLAKFLREYISRDENNEKINDMIRFLSTQSVLSVMRKYISAKEQPILYVPSCKGWNVIDDRKKIEH